MIGDGAASSCQGNNNIAIGSDAFSGSISPAATGNIAIGTDALVINDGAGNIGIGFSALAGNVIGVNTIAIGNIAGSADLIGTDNI